MTGTSGPGAAAGDRAPATGAVVEPRRLHPMTVVLGAWKAVLFLFVILGRPALEGQGSMVTDLAPAVGLGGGAAGTVLVGALLLLAVVVAGIVLSIVPWAFRRFGADGHELVVTSGFVRRRRRQVRLDRVQALDIDEPLVARLFGLSVLRITMAAGNEASIRLAYLSLEDAVALRNRFLAGAAGLRHDTPQAPERVLNRVTPAMAAGALLLSPAALLLMAVVVAVVVVSVVTDQWLVLPSFIPVLLGLGAALLRQLNGTVNFTLAESPDGYRVRAGLLDRRSQTVPPGRVQGLRLRRPLLWRAAGWSRVDVDVAGLGARDRDGGGEQVQRTDLLPVARRADAASVAGLVLGVDPETVAMIPVPRRARWLDPLAARVLAVGSAGEVVVSREGLLSPTLTAVPYAKVQSVRVTQGPLQRRLRLASVHVDSPKGPVELTLPHRAIEEVPALVADVLARARQARALAGPDRWMSRAPGAGTGRQLGTDGPQPARVAVPAAG